MNSKFLDEKSSEDLLDDIQVDLKKLIISSSYNEIKLVEKINSLPDEDQKELQLIAANCAIVGVGGNNKYGFVLDGDSQRSLESSCKKFLKNSELNPDDLSIRRLTRVYRFKIKKLLSINPEIQPYLFRKYTTKDNRYRSICFPGAEYMVERQEEINYLLTMYRNMDKLQNTDFETRYIRVITARGLSNLLN